MPTRIVIVFLLLLAAGSAVAAEPPEFLLVETTPVETEGLDDPAIPQAHEQWLDMIDGARKEILVASFYFSDDPDDPDDRLDRVLAALARAADRGVSVRLLSDAGFHKTYPDIPDRFAELYAASCDPTSPELSPLRANLRGLPPTLIQVGGAESLLSEGCEFAAKARAAGVQVSLQKWEGMVHAWQGYSFALPDARDAIAEVGRYVHRLYGARAAIEQRPIPTLAPAFAGPTRSRR